MSKTATQQLLETLKKGSLDHCIAQLEYADPKEEAHIEGYTREAAIKEIQSCCEGWAPTSFPEIDLAQVDWTEFAKGLDALSVTNA
jgi:hypothetical protein